MKRVLSVVVCICLTVPLTFLLSTCGGGGKKEPSGPSLITNTQTLPDGCTIMIKSPGVVTYNMNPAPSSYPSGSKVSVVGVTGTLDAGQTAEISFTDPGGFDSNDKIAFVDSNVQWSSVTSSLSTDKKTISSTVDHFSNWGVLDTTKPSIASVDPKNGAVNVPITDNVLITFSERMDKTKTQGAFSLTDGITPVVGAFSWSGNTMIFNPGSDLISSTIYYLTVGIDAEEAAGNHLAAPLSSSFTTSSLPDTKKPTVTVVSPYAGATGAALDTNVSITFSEQMNMGSAEAAFLLTDGVAAVKGKFGWNGSTMTFTPISDLKYSTTYTVSVGMGATDTSGNPLAALFNSSFTTEINMEGYIDEGFNPSITMDQENNVHISYAQMVGSELFLKYQNLSDDTSGEVNLSASGYDMYYSGSLAIDNNGTIHVCFREASSGASSGDLVYGSKAPGGVFSFETLDSAWDSASMAIDSKNHAHISYYAYSTLFYLTNVGGSWSSPEEIDTVGGQLEGMHTAIAVHLEKNGTESVYISYVGGDMEDYRFAKRACNAQPGSTWEITQIANGDFQSAGNSIAVDGDDKVHISYFDNASGTLKYATNATGSWVTKDVDTTYDAGLYNSISVDSQGYAHISYCISGVELWYATNTLGAFVSTLVDDSGDAYESHIAVAPNGSIYIIYSSFGSIFMASP